MDGSHRGDTGMIFDSFLDANGWGDAREEPLAGDASSRRYIRLYSGAKRAILMIDPQGDTACFAHLATHLREVNLSAPEIYDHTSNLMLLEDLGDAQFARVAKDQPDMECTLYAAATDVLCHLETRLAPSDLTSATPELLGRMIEPAFTHYLPLLGQNAGASASEIQLRLTDLLSLHLPADRVLVLRDYHAENLIWLPDRDDVRRVGLLDFQDALKGPPIYDLVSLLQDARRDVSDNCYADTLARYIDQSGRSESSVLPAFHLLGLQRNLRILGIFARLAMEQGKPSYLSLIPRVWRYIKTSLASPIAREVEPLITDLFPEPTPERLTPRALS